MSKEKKFGFADLYFLSMQALLIFLQLESGKNDWKKKTNRLNIMTRVNFQIMNVFIFLNLTWFFSSQQQSGGPNWL